MFLHESNRLQVIVGTRGAVLEDALQFRPKLHGQLVQQGRVSAPCPPGLLHQRLSGPSQGAILNRLEKPRSRPRCGIAAARRR